MADIDVLLAEWKAAKEEHLFKLFGNELILKREVDIQIDEDTLDSKIHNLYKHISCKTFNDVFSREVCARVEDWEQRQKIFGLELDLKTNIYSRESFIFFDKTTEKKYQVQKGCSVMKTYSKLARDWGIQEEFEAYRIAHSQVLNQKNIKGTLCLSIHPLDYLTMSNTNSWLSCLTWEKAGCCRQGSVEMMNSPTAIVAYVEGNEPFKLPEDETDWTWNNKIWRDTFVIHPLEDDLGTFITEVKSYPFQNDELSRICMDWIMELAEARGALQTPNEYMLISLKDNCSMEFELETSCMYNDIERLNGVKPLVYIPQRYIDALPYPPPQKKDNPYRLYSKTPNLIDVLYVPFSGKTQCMWCGRSILDDYYCYIDEELENMASRLTCDNCGYEEECSICGRMAGVEDLLYDEDTEEFYCQDCWDRYHLDPED